MNRQDNITLKSLKAQLPEEDRPREKAKRLGFEALSIAELMAIIIGSGARGENVVGLCQRILQDHNNKLYQVARKGMKELMKYRGIGEVKALEMLAALEIARRYQLEKFDDQFQISCSGDAYQFLQPLMSDLDHEEIWIVLLNRAKKVIARNRVSAGGTSATVGDVKIILKTAIEQLADCIILAHNHPSDTPSPSRADDQLTERVKNACQAIDIPLIDHIIVCRGGNYYSYGDHARL